MTPAFSAAQSFAVPVVVHPEAVKNVGWCYPTSDGAKRFGYYRTGCWSVALHFKCGKLPIYLAGFGDREQAVKFAQTLPNDWAKWGTAEREQA